MSDPVTSIPALPRASAFLDGTDRIKPLHHKAGALQQFVIGFEAVPLAREAAESILKLSRFMKESHKTTVRNTARNARMNAKEMMAEGSEFASNAIPTLKPAPTFTPHGHGEHCGPNCSHVLTSGGSVGYTNRINPALRESSKKGWLVASIFAAVGVGIYFINEHSKSMKTIASPYADDWKNRVDTALAPAEEAYSL